MPDRGGKGGTVAEWLRPEPWTVAAANVVLILSAWVYIADLEPIGPPASTPNLLATGYMFGLVVLAGVYARLGESTVQQVWMRNLLIFVATLMLGYLPPPPLVDALALMIIIHFSFTLLLLGLVFLVQRVRR